MVLVEARVLRRHYSVLKVGRDLAEGNKLVAFVIRSVANPGLQAALDVHCGCWWVDPPGGHKDKSGNQPNKYCSSKKPSNEGSEKPLAEQGLGVGVWLFSQFPE
jgi:hypothetical protein